MSAQAGVWNFDGKPAESDLLEKLSDAIAQYGPDAEKTIVLGPVGMLYRPLHTTLESRVEHQPHVSGRGYVITWDGRLDNRDELLPQIWDELTERTDVAIAMAAFEKWGTACFCKLVGDWALVIWDPGERTLILARDYAAIRHLYYYKTHEKIIWCTHLAPIVILSGTQFTLNDEYIAGYLALWPESHLTPYREIHSVPPGTFVCIRDASTRIHSYWTFDPKRWIRYKTDAGYEEHFRHVFRQAVQRRLRSDSPILAELSGGLDSSSTVCMADDILAKGTGEAARLDTLSYYDTSEPGGDERPYFTRVEEKRGRPGHRFDAARYDNSLALSVPHFMATPGFAIREGDSENQLLSLMKKHGYRVVLSGIGGDEFLGGVPDPRAQLADLILQLRAAQLIKQLLAWSLAKRRPWIQLFFQALAVLLPRSLGATLMQEAKVPAWIDAGFTHRNRIGLRQMGPLDDFGFWLPSKRDYAQTFVSVTRQIAYASERNSPLEERRYPYLDQSLLEFLIAIPESQLLRPGERRSLMRRALKGLVPSEVLNRKTKAVTARRHMVAIATSWPKLESLMEAPIASQLGYIDHVRFREELLKAKNGDAPHLLRMLKGVALELWLRDLAARGLVRLPTQVSKVFERAWVASGA